MKKLLIVALIALSTTFIASTSKAADICCGLLDDLYAPDWTLNFYGINGTSENYTFSVTGISQGNYLESIPDGKYSVSFYTNYNYPSNIQPDEDHVWLYYSDGSNGDNPSSAYKGIDGVYFVADIDSNTYSNGWYFYAFQDPSYYIFSRMCTESNLL